MKKLLSLILTLVLVLPLAGCGDDQKKQDDAVSGSAAGQQVSEEASPDDNKYIGKSPEEILASLSLEQKAAQMPNSSSITSRTANRRKNYGKLLYTSGTSTPFEDEADTHCLQKASDYRIQHFVIASQIGRAHV